MGHRKVVIHLKTRRLDKNGDYSFGQNLQDYEEGINAVAQNIKTKVSLFQGEWWESLGEGIPMFQSIIGEMNPEALKISSSLLITERIKEIEQVQSVEDVEPIREGRKLIFNVTANTTEGKVEVVI